MKSNVIRFPSNKDASLQARAEALIKVLDHQHRHISKTIETLSMMEEQNEASQVEYESIIAEMIEENEGAIAQRYTDYSFEHALVLAP